MFVIKQIGGAIQLTIALPNQVQTLASDVKKTILDKGKGKMSTLLDGSKEKVVAAALTLLQAIDTVETTMGATVPLVDTMVRIPLTAAIKTIDSSVPVLVERVPETAAECNSANFAVAMIRNSASFAVSLPKQIFNRAWVFINNSHNTWDVYQIISTAFLPFGMKADCMEGSPYELNVNPGYFDSGAAADKIAITIHYRGLSRRRVSPLIAQRVHSNMHYPVDLRPFEAVVKLQLKELDDPDVDNVEIFADNKHQIIQLPASSADCAEQAYTPLSFPPSPGARTQVLAYHSRRATNVLCGARDKLAEQSMSMSMGVEMSPAP